MTIKYHIHMPQDFSCGQRGFDDDVTIKIKSGDPGGDAGEFIRFMKDCLREWFDGAIVEDELK